MNSTKIIISGGTRPFWQLAIASLLYTFMFILLYYFVRSLQISPNSHRLQGNVAFLEMAIFMVPFAIGFSMVKDVYFDLEKNRYKEKYCFGPYGFGKWKKLPEIEYVSIFKQPKANGTYVYETNLWYHKNKHFNILESDSKGHVLEMGKTASKILGVDLLVATIPNSYKWL